MLRFQLETAKHTKRIARLLDRKFSGLRAMLDGTLTNVRRHCADTADAIAAAKTLANLLHNWQPPIPKQQKETGQSGGGTTESQEEGMEEQDEAASASDEKPPAAPYVRVLVSPLKECLSGASEV